MDAGHLVQCPLVDDDVVAVVAADPHDTLDEGRVPVVHTLVLDLDLRFSAEAPLWRGPRLEPRLAHVLVAAGVVEVEVVSARRGSVPDSRLISTQVERVQEVIGRGRERRRGAGRAGRRGVAGRRQPLIGSTRNDADDSDMTNLNLEIQKWASKLP